MKKQPLLAQIAAVNLKNLPHASCTKMATESQLLPELMRYIQPQKKKKCGERKMLPYHSENLRTSVALSGTESSTDLLLSKQAGEKAPSC